MEKQIQEIHVIVPDASQRVVKLVIKDMATGKDHTVNVDIGAATVTIVTP